MRIGMFLTAIGAALVCPFYACAAEIDLNGGWRFAYSAKLPLQEVNERFTVAVMIKPPPRIPNDDQFALELEVPGYWDEQLGYTPEAPWANEIAYYEGTGSAPIRFPYTGTGRPRHPDAGRPFIIGTGWYKKTLDVPEDWRGRSVMLRLGGARIDTYCFVNGIYVDMHHGHDTPFEFSIADPLKYGQENEIVLAVTNRLDYINSCALRGYQGQSGGIYGNVALHVSEGAGHIVSYHVYPEGKLERMRWKAEVQATDAPLDEDTLVTWSVSTLTGQRIHEGREPVRPLASNEVLCLDWACPAEGLKPWSVWEPTLHRIEIRWERKDGSPIDSDSRRYGLRQLESRDNRLYLNERPVMLRGVCEIYSFAPDVHPPNDVEYFRNRVHRLKELGFNYLRFHTWVPMEPYMQAADEVGMLMGPEHSISPTRNPLDDPRWTDMVRWCRYHPSVVTYCGGNEEVGHEGLIAKFAERYRQAKALAPDCLVVPMHTMSGPESESGHADLPVPQSYSDQENYHETLWSRVTRHADLFASRANDFSYSNFTGRDWRVVEPEYARYQRPILAHETGIIGTYLNLALEERYTASTPGDLYAAARKYIGAAGRIDKAPVYHENSARWHGQARKFVTENLRKCDVFDGYDLLGAWDSHWHNSGYGCGLLNEFFELKPGDTLERVLHYNGESALLLDNAKRHVFCSGEAFDMPIMSSLYGGAALRGGTLAWEVLCGNEVLLNGKLTGLDAPDGAVSTLGNIRFAWPKVEKACHLVLQVNLKDPAYDLANQWDLWLFPERPAPSLAAAADAEAFALLAARYTGVKPIPTADARLRIVTAIREDDARHLADGGDVLLLGTKPFPANPTRYQIGVAGRAHMNLATVIAEHQSLKYMPHDGWCDWQFQSLLENGECVEFNKIPSAFDPILEIVSSYKYIRLQSALWEAKTEGGRLFVVSLHLDLEDPATLALLDGIIEYVQGDAFRPTVEISIEKVIKPLLAGVPFKGLRDNDGNYYAGMSLF